MAIAKTPNVYLDALDRAWRSFQQNILLDALAATATGTLVILGQLPLNTTEFWGAVGILFAKSVLVSLGAYLHRLRNEPTAFGTAVPASVWVLADQGVAAAQAAVTAHEPAAVAPAVQAAEEHAAPEGVTAVAPTAGV